MSLAPALLPFFTRWLRIEEAKLFAEIAAAGLDADEAHDVFVSQMDGGAIGAVKGKARLPDAVGVEPPPSKTIKESAPVGGRLGSSPAGSGADAIPATIKPNRLRPLCQNPSNCAGYGDKTCHACLVAADRGGAA